MNNSRSDALIAQPDLQKESYPHMASTTQAENKDKVSGWRFFFIFAAFFGVIIAVNAVFIYNAMNSHSGVVTDDAYRKGLAYNDILDRAQNQPHWIHKVTFEDGVLRWFIQQEDGSPLDNAQVSVSFFRPIRSGDDFSATLSEVQAGVYEIRPDFPHKGAWRAGLKAVKDGLEFQAAHNLVIR